MNFDYIFFLYLIRIPTGGVGTREVDDSFERVVNVGFSHDAGVATEAHQRDKLERKCQLTSKLMSGAAAALMSSLTAIST